MAEARIIRQKIRGAGVQIGEIASPAAGNADLLGRMPRLLEQQHRASPLAGDGGAHQPGSARPEDDDVMKRSGHSTSSTSTATPSFCLRDPTRMPSTGETSEKPPPTA